MTEPEKNDFTIPKNEETIDDLIQDLEDKCSTSEFGQGDDSEEKQKNDKKVESPFDDLIDEEKLKEEEKSLSEEEKLSRKNEAEKIKLEGNDKFKNGLFAESIDFYTKALRICPPSFGKERSILYSNRAASKINLNYKETALDDLKMAIDLNPDYIRALFRRAKLYNDMDKLDESLEDYKKIQSLDSTNSEAIYAIKNLTIQIEERNEKMKEEMLGKLKDLGNMILKPFGLSTENFQLNKDPNSGGYSVNFNQNAKK